MKNLKTTHNGQNEDQYSGVGNGMREKKSKLRKRGYVHCQTVIFWFATVVLVTFFIQQVSIMINIYFVSNPHTFQDDKMLDKIC